MWNKYLDPDIAIWELRYRILTTSFVSLSQSSNFCRELTLIIVSDEAGCHMTVVVMKKTSIWIQTKQQFWEEELAEVQPVAWLSFTPHQQIMKQCPVHFTPGVSVISKPICNTGKKPKKQPWLKCSACYSFTTVTQHTETSPLTQLPRFGSLWLQVFSCWFDTLVCQSQKHERKLFRTECRE